MDETEAGKCTIILKEVERNEINVTVEVDSNTHFVRFALARTLLEVFKETLEKLVINDRLSEEGLTVLVAELSSVADTVNNLTPEDSTLSSVNEDSDTVH